MQLFRMTDRRRTMNSKAVNAYRCGKPGFATILKVTRALGLTQAWRARARRARRVQRRLTQSHMRNVTAAPQSSFLNSARPEIIGGSGPWSTGRHNPWWERLSEMPHQAFLFG